MPFSANTFDPYVSKFLNEDKPETVLDIGPGSGKYGKMLKIQPYKIKITGVEVFKEYVTKFRLNDIYDELVVQDIKKFIKSNMDRCWDWCIAGDVLEHMTKSDGLDLIHELSYVCKNIIIISPMNARQGAEFGNAYERHLSRWDWLDFMSFDVRAVLRNKNMFLIKLFCKFTI